MKKRINKIFLYTSVILSIGLILGTSSYKIIKKNHDKILLVEEKLIIETVKDCLNKNICAGDHITLKDLYEKDLLEKQVNNVTKEYYNELSYVLVEDGSYTFVIL